MHVHAYTVVHNSFISQNTYVFRTPVEIFSLLHIMRRKLTTVNLPVYVRLIR